MKKFKKYAPWIIATGAIAIAIGTHRFYASKSFLELPVIKLNGKLTTLIPTIDNPFTYILPDGEKLAIHAIEMVESAVTTV